MVLSPEALPPVRNRIRPCSFSAPRTKFRVASEGKRALSGALERGERRVDLERVGDVLGALVIDVVVAKAANESRFALLAAAETF